MTDETIARILPEEVEARELSRLFATEGAVILTEDDRVLRLLESVLDWVGFANAPVADSDAFDSDLIGLARNHEEGNMRAGDMLRFVPSSFGHIARKFLVYPCLVDGSLQAFPSHFAVRHRRVPVPYHIRQWSWTLMSDVLMSALPEHAGRLDYAVEVSVLVYPTSRADLQRVNMLLADSGGFWSQLGRRIDANKGNAAGVFDKSGIRDLYAMASLIPGVSRLVAKVNDRMSSGTNALPADQHVIGGPHIDNSKYITGLAGCRDGMVTQIDRSGRWVSLPITSDCLALFPSRKITPLNGVSPTRHRVLLCDSPEQDTTARRNITLSLSIVDRPKTPAASAHRPADVTSMFDARQLSERPATSIEEEIA